MQNDQEARWVVNYLHARGWKVDIVDVMHFFAPGPLRASGAAHRSSSPERRGGSGDSAGGDQPLADQAEKSSPLSGTAGERRGLADVVRHCVLHPCTLFAALG